MLAGVLIGKSIPQLIDQFRRLEFGDQAVSREGFDGVWVRVTGLLAERIGVALVLLGMMKYTTFASGPAADAPVAYALQQLGARPVWRAIIVIGAMMGMLSSLLVFQYGQARVWFAMSRDGLLPALFSAVHKKFKTPHVTTMVTGLIIAVIAAFTGCCGAGKPP